MHVWHLTVCQAHSGHSASGIRVAAASIQVTEPLPQPPSPSPSLQWVFPGPEGKHVDGTKSAHLGLTPGSATHSVALWPWAGKVLLAGLCFLIFKMSTI